MTREHKLRQAIIEEIDGYKYNGIGESWTRTDEGIVIQYPSGSTTICKDWLMQPGTENLINLAIHFYKLGQQGGLMVEKPDFDDVDPKHLVHSHLITKGGLGL